MATDINGVDLSNLYVQGQIKQDVAIENPNGQLDGDDFLKLFLESLKFQDPTSPVETQDMMVQTAQLTTVETNVANREALETVTQTLINSQDYQSQFGLIPAIGKLAVTTEDSVAYDGLLDVDFELYFENPPTDGNIFIEDANGNPIRTISINDYQNSNNQVGEDESGLNIADTTGILKFKWDGNNDAGTQVESGAYKISASYVGQDAKRHNIDLGTSQVESVKFENGIPYVKLGSNYIAFDKISEIK